MTEVPEVYSDAFAISTGPWGVLLTFQSRDSASPETLNALSRVRMSTEHLKSVVFIAWRNILGYEKTNGVRYDVPEEVLSAIGIPQNEWDEFWRRNQDER